MKIAIVINSTRLTSELKSQLNSKELTDKFNIDYDFYIAEPNNLDETLKKIKSQSYNALIVGGGDGTVRSCADALMDSDMPLAILPLGTFNLLAKAINYPNDIAELFSIIKNGKTKKIDLAEVNGKIIINHAWIGFYYYILKLRKKNRAIIGKSKLLKMIFNTLSLFRTLPIYHLKLKVENVETFFKTCLVYIANNEFKSNIFDLWERKSLSTGMLSVKVLNCQTRWELFLCMLHILFNFSSQSKYISECNTNELIIESNSKFINVVIDGELFKLNTPLHFINHHKKLTVFTP